MLERQEETGSDGERGRGWSRDFCLGQAEQAWTREEGGGRMEIEHNDLLELAPDRCLSSGRTWSWGRRKASTDLGDLVLSPHADPSDSGQANEQDSSVSPKQPRGRAFHQIFRLH